MLAEACRVKEAVFFDEKARLPHARRPGPSVRARAARQAPGWSNSRRTQLVEHPRGERLLPRPRGVLRRDVRQRPGVGDGPRPRAASWAARRFCPASSRCSSGGSAAAACGPGSRSRRSPTAAACFAADRVATARLHRPRLRVRSPTTPPAARRSTPSSCRSGTRFPTAPDFWKRQLVPTCSLGEPESIFRLVICEVARGRRRRTAVRVGRRGRPAEGRRRDRQSRGRRAAQRREPDARLPRSAARTPGSPAAPRHRRSASTPNAGSSRPCTTCSRTAN